MYCLSRYSDVTNIVVDIANRWEERGGGGVKPCQLVQ